MAPLVPLVKSCLTVVSNFPRMSWNLMIVLSRSISCCCLSICLSNISFFICFFCCFVFYKHLDKSFTFGSTMRSRLEEIHKQKAVYGVGVTRKYAIESFNLKHRIPQSGLQRSICSDLSSGQSSPPPDPTS